MATKGKSGGAVQTRNTIIETAAFLFWKHSFHSVSVDQLSEAAKVNKATIYRHFTDKAAIARAVAKHYGDKALQEFFDPARNTELTAQARLALIYRNLFLVYECSLQDHGGVFGCPILGLALELGQEMPEVREEADRIFTEIEDRFLEIVHLAHAEKPLASPPRTIARTLLQLLHGALASARLSNNPDRILDASEASLALLGRTTIPLDQVGELQ